MGVRICEDCGAYLDPGEICDCRKEEEDGQLGADSGSAEAVRSQRCV